jgi:hypothetical protein
MMSDTKKFVRKVGTKSYLRKSIREIIDSAEESPDEWVILELHNKRGTAQLDIEIKVVNGKPRFRLLGQETTNQTNVYAIAMRELNIEEWSK